MIKYIIIIIIIKSRNRAGECICKSRYDTVGIGYQRTSYGRHAHIVQSCPIIICACSEMTRGTIRSSRHLTNVNRFPYARARRTMSSDFFISRDRRRSSEWVVVVVAHYLLFRGNRSKDLRRCDIAVRPGKCGGVLIFYVGAEESGGVLARNTLRTRERRFRCTASY